MVAAAAVLQRSLRVIGVMLTLSSTSLTNLPAFMLIQITTSDNVSRPGSADGTAFVVVCCAIGGVERVVWVPLIGCVRVGCHTSRLAGCAWLESGLFRRGRIPVAVILIVGEDHPSKT